MHKHKHHEQDKDTHKDKYTKTNIQRQIHKDKYTKTNTQRQIHKDKYTKTNMQRQSTVEGQNSFAQASRVASIMITGFSKKWLLKRQRLMYVFTNI